MALTKADLSDIKLIVTEVVEPRFVEIDQRFDTVDRRLEAVDGRLDGLEGWLGRVEGGISGLKLAIETLAKATKQQSDAVFVELGDIKEDVAVVKDIVKDHSFRIARLEHRAA